MEQDPGLKHMAFPFIRVAPRPGKPRESGLTIVADRGIEHLQELVASIAAGRRAPPPRVHTPEEDEALDS